MVYLMKVKHLTDVKEEIVTKASSTKTTVQWLITEKDGAKRFATRRFEIQPGGQVGLHEHPEDHQIFVLQGTCQLLNEKGNKVELKSGDAIYIPPDEKHGFENNGTDTFAFICVIPYLR
jgi:quercetin dioxygenase-like cupin family protein